MTLQAEIHTLAFELRKRHQTMDLAVLEEAVTAGAMLVMAQTITKLRETTAELAETRLKTNRPQ